MIVIMTVIRSFGNAEDATMIVIIRVITLIIFIMIVIIVIDFIIVIMIVMIISFFYTFSNVAWAMLVMPDTFSCHTMPFYLVKKKQLSAPLSTPPSAAASCALPVDTPGRCW